MDHSTSLYEPKLVDRWAERYRNFETDEMIGRLRETHRNVRAAALQPLDEEPQAA